MSRADRGEFRPCLNEAVLPPPNTTGDEWILGKRSCGIGFDDAKTGVRTFLVHCFIGDDGSLGAWEVPDPKWLYIPEEGVAYIPEETFPGQRQ